MKVARLGALMGTTGLGIFDGEEILEGKMPGVRKTVEIDGSDGPFAQVCQVFEAGKGKKAS